MTADNRGFDADEHDDSQPDDNVRPEGQMEDDSVEPEMVDDELSDEYDDDDFEDDDWEEEEDESRGPSKKRKRVFCKHCNRMETHRPDRSKSTLRSFVTGLTFGLNLIFGRIQCVCCGHYRLKYKLTGSKKK